MIRALNRLDKLMVIQNLRGDARRETNVLCSHLGNMVSHDVVIYSKIIGFVSFLWLFSHREDGWV